VALPSAFVLTDVGIGVAESCGVACGGFVSAFARVALIAPAVQSKPSRRIRDTERSKGRRVAWGVTKFFIGCRSSSSRLTNGPVPFGPAVETPCDKIFGGVFRKEYFPCLENIYEKYIRSRNT
jgi:hypothetical protein